MNHRTRADLALAVAAAWNAGMLQSEIAARCGLSRSTVSIILSAARTPVLNISERNAVRRTTSPAKRLTKAAANERALLRQSLADERASRQQRIIELWNAGAMTQAQIAEALGVSAKSVVRYLLAARRAGVSVKHWPPGSWRRTAEVRARIIAAWNAGQSVGDISRAVGRCVYTVYKIVKAARPTGAAITPEQRKPASRAFYRQQRKRRLRGDAKGPSGGPQTRPGCVDASITG